MLKLKYCHKCIGDMTLPIQIIKKNQMSRLNAISQFSHFEKIYSVDSYYINTHLWLSF